MNKTNLNKKFYETATFKKAAFVLAGWIFTAAAFIPIFSHNIKQQKLEEKMYPLAFPSRKVLTISSKEYCEMSGKSLNDYLPISVRGYTSKNYSRRNRFLYKVPEDAEVVVSFNRSALGTYGEGTALIPIDPNSPWVTQPSLDGVPDFW